jgi:hypothetical protein
VKRCCVLFLEGALHLVCRCVECVDVEDGSIEPVLSAFHISLRMPAVQVSTADCQLQQVVVCSAECVPDIRGCLFNDACHLHCVAIAPSAKIIVNCRDL